MIIITPLAESVLKMIRRTSPETVVVNCPITEVSRESGNLKGSIFADPRNCYSHDPLNHAKVISQELCIVGGSAHQLFQVTSW